MAGGNQASMGYYISCSLFRFWQGHVIYAHAVYMYRLLKKWIFYTGGSQTLLHPRTAFSPWLHALGGLIGGGMCHIFKLWEGCWEGWRQSETRNRLVWRFVYCIESAPATMLPNFEATPVIFSDILSMPTLVLASVSGYSKRKWDGGI